MASIYSIRITDGTFAVGLSAVVYTVPAGNVFVLRDIQAWPDTGTTSSLNVVFTGTSIMASIGGITAANPGHWEGRVVFNAGETIKLLVGGGQLEVSLSGYLLVA